MDWRLRRRDQPEGTAEEPLDCDLLILPVDAKSAPSASEMKRLTAYLDGGVLLVEPCAKASGDAQKLIASIAQGVGRQPQPVKRNHPLLTVRHVFSAPPPGASTGQLFEADGLLVSTNDYARGTAGCPTRGWTGATSGRRWNSPKICSLTPWFGEGTLAVYRPSRPTSAAKREVSNGRQDRS